MTTAYSRKQLVLSNSTRMGPILLCYLMLTLCLFRHDSRQLLQVSATTSGLRSSFPQKEGIPKLASKSTTENAAEESRQVDTLIEGDWVVDRRLQTYNSTWSTLETAKGYLNNATHIYNSTKQTFTDTATTPPSQWQKHQWVFVSIILAISLCLIGCVWKSIPCTPRII